MFERRWSLLLLAVPVLLGASLDRAIFIEALRSADVATCARDHELPLGRWVVRVTLGRDGTARDVKVTEHPAAVTEAGLACVADAFQAVRYPEAAGPVREETCCRPDCDPVVCGPARDAGDGKGEATIQIFWPFRLAVADVDVEDASDPEAAEAL